MDGQDRGPVGGHRWLLAPAGVGLVVLVVLALTVAQVPAFGLDAWGEHRNPPSPPWREIANGLNWLGQPAGAALVLTTGTWLCLRLGRIDAAGVLCAGSALSVASTSTLKPLVGRHIHQHFLSYPSGHAAFATSCALALGLLRVHGRRGGRATLVACAAALAGGATMSWAQVTLNAHYVTDTLGGIATALTVVPLVVLAVDRVIRATGTRPGRGTPPAPRRAP